MPSLALSMIVLVIWQSLYSTGSPLLDDAIVASKQNDAHDLDNGESGAIPLISRDKSNGSA